MTTLILLLPQRKRLGSPGRDAEDAAAGSAAADYDYLLSQDGQQLSAQGRCAIGSLPKADRVLLMPADADIAWFRITLPRAGRQMREALSGLLEEQLLEDPQQLAFAVEPGASGGQQAWVAVFAKSLLLPPLAALEQAGIHVERVLPLGAPDGSISGHVQGHEEAPLLRLSTTQGVSMLPLAGSLARALLPSEPCRYSAEPALVAAAERWLGGAVAPLTRAERALAALGTDWELRQFELAPRARGLQRLGQAWRSLQAPAWRPLRWGVAALLGVQLLGLNLVAWQQRRSVEAQRAAIVQTVREAHPQLRALLDAPLQMRRETELLRAQAGQPGEQDLETLLAAAARAWPAERAPADSLRFETGLLTLPLQGWAPQQIEQFRAALQAEGWRLDNAEGRASISRASRR